jgi:hypothetical protein
MLLTCPIGQRNIWDCEKLVGLIDDRTMRHMRQQGSPKHFTVDQMNHEILVKNREILMNTQKRCLDWLRIISGNVRYYSHQRAVLREKFPLSFD